MAAVLSYLAPRSDRHTWMVHHQLFEVIRRADTAAVWINLALPCVYHALSDQLLGRQPTAESPRVTVAQPRPFSASSTICCVLYATDSMPGWANGVAQILRWRAALRYIGVPQGSPSCRRVGGAWGLVPLGRAVRRIVGPRQPGVAADDADDEDETITRAQIDRFESVPGRVTGGPRQRRSAIAAARCGSSVSA
jgi:hypothetical protein